MNRSEAKFQHTAAKMQEALIRLLDKKDFRNISVSEICGEAGVNRSTFYAHYENTYDLLKEIQADSIHSFRMEFGRENSLDNLANKPMKELVFLSRDYLIPYLEFIRKNKKLYRVYMDNDKIFGQEEYDDFLIKVLTPILQKVVADERQVDYMLRYYLGGINSIVKTWVARDCREDILVLSETIIACILPRGTII